MPDQKPFLAPALALALALGLAACGPDAVEAPPAAEEAGFDQVDQVPIDAARDADANGMIDVEEGTSVQAPDTGRAATPPASPSYP